MDADLLDLLAQSLELGLFILLSGGVSLLLTLLGEVLNFQTIVLRQLACPICLLLPSSRPIPFPVCGWTTR